MRVEGREGVKSEPGNSGGRGKDGWRGEGEVGEAWMGRRRSVVKEGKGLKASQEIAGNSGSRVE
jgi:hypothetical protein